MAKFIAIKIHYDHRANLPHYLKYSRLSTEKEYQEYIDLYEKEGVGGNGFHECLNFATSCDGDVKFYIPPTCVPKDDREEYIVFSFTYQGDKEMPSSIIGVHAGGRIEDRYGVVRSDYPSISKYQPLEYIASANSDLTTIFSTPLEYNHHDGTFIPELKKWGNGLRYLKAEHAKRIIRAAFENAELRLDNSQVSLSERQVIEKEIRVLCKINSQFFQEALCSKHSENDHFVSSLADQELGYLGELEVYHKEVSRLEEMGLDTSLVEWVSQSVPSSVYDIKSVRKNANGQIEDHYLEVKASKLALGENVYFSSRQVKFFDENPMSSEVVFVNFETEVVKILYKSFNEVMKDFSLKPVKYKLVAN